MDKHGWFERVETDKDTKLLVYLHKHSGSHAVIEKPEQIGNAAIDALGCYAPLLNWFDNANAAKEALWINSVHISAKSIDGKVRPIAVHGVVDLGHHPRRIVINDDQASLLIVVQDKQKKVEPEIIVLRYDDGTDDLYKSIFMLPTERVSLGWNYPKEKKPTVLWDGWLFKAINNEIRLRESKTLHIERVLTDPDSTGVHYFGLIEINRHSAGLEVIRNAVSRASRDMPESRYRPCLCPITFLIKDDILSPHIISDPALATALNAYKAMKADQMYVKISEIVSSGSNPLSQRERLMRLHKSMPAGLFKSL